MTWKMAEPGLLVGRWQTTFYRGTAVLAQAPEVASAPHPRQRSRLIAVRVDQDCVAPPLQQVADTAVAARWRGRAQTPLGWRMALEKFGLGATARGTAGESGDNRRIPNRGRSADWVSAHSDGYLA